MRNIFRKLLVSLSLIVAFTNVTIAAFNDNLNSSTSVINISLNSSQVQQEAVTGFNTDNGEVVFSLGDQQRFISQSGQPEIPYQIVNLLLAPDTDLSTVYVQMDADYGLVNGSWSVRPVPAMATWDENGNEKIVWPANANIVDGYDIDIYSSDSFWPTTEAKIMSIGQLREYKLAEIALPLYRYNPISGELLSLVQADITINNKSVKSGTVVKSSGYVSNSDSIERLKSLTLNFAQAAEAYGVGDATTKSPTLTDKGYVIITTNTIKNNSTKLASFVAHKQAKYTVNVITETQYGSGSGDAAANNIRAWLQSNYNNSAYGSGGILYVLLIGDPRTTSSSVPMKMCLANEETPHPTDYFYGELSSNWDSDGDGIYGEQEDTTDKYFEVYTGRIPFYGSISDLDSILQKFITYETQTNTDWRRNALLPMVPLDDNTPAYQLGEQIKYNFLEPKAISSDRIYEHEYGVIPVPEFTLSKTYPANQWSKGIYGMVIWMTHGWDQGASHIISTGEVSSLNNNYPSAVWQGSCMNGHPETTTNLGYSILKNGGIGTVAASRNGWYWVGESSFTNSSSVGGLGYQYAKRIIERKTLGQAIWDSKEAMSFWHKNYLVYNLYGDPSIQVMPEQPDFTTSPTHGVFFKVAHSSTTSVSSLYTLTNNSGSALNWTATKGEGDWYTISATNGTLAAGSTVNINIDLASGSSTLPVGTYKDTIVITDVTNNIVENRVITLEVYPTQKIAYWPLNETTGTDVIDVMGNGHNGTLANTDFDTASTVGKSGNALVFDGTDDHIEIPGFTENINQLTISTWINATNWNGNRRLLQKGGDGSEYRLLIENGKFVFEVGSSRLQVTSLPATGTWVHVVAVYDGNNMKLYYDKELKGTLARTGMVPTSNNALFIGSKNAGAPAGDRFIGAMDEVQIFNYAKDQAGIAELYDCKDLPEVIRPYDHSAGATLLIELKWIMGINAVDNDIYFGADLNAVMNADTNSSIYKGRQSLATFDPGVLAKNKEYFWRVDQINAVGEVTKAPVWSFTTGDGCGGITRQFWGNISDNYVTSLTNNSRYPNNPDYSEIITSFEGPVNAANDYGSRIYGFLVPPVTGSYTFWIASDDYSELWLGADYLPSSAVKIAAVNGHTGIHNWTVYSSQKSANISLIAGQPYYIMALHKEGGGDDHIAVAFSGPGIDQQVISGEYLMPYAEYDWKPVFNAANIYGSNALESYTYSGTIAGSASSIAGDVLYSKASGPLWLQIAEDGTLSGIPGDSDVGYNSFEVRATDTDGNFSEVPMTIIVEDVYTGVNGIGDFAAIATQWLIGDCVPGNACQGADLNGDNTVNLIDIEAFCYKWLTASNDDGIEGRWPFDSDASDLTGKHNGLFVNGVTISDDFISEFGTGSAVFDGVDDYLIVPGYKGITGTTARTCAAWIKTTSNQLGCIMSWGEGINGQKWMFRTEASGTLAVGVFGGFIQTLTTVNDGQWHHVAVVMHDDGTPDVSELALYIDGVIQKSTYNNKIRINTVAGNDFIIGAYNESGLYHFNGEIDDIRLYSRELSKSEIKNLSLEYNQVSLRFDEVAGSSAYDDSLYSRIFSINNGVQWQPTAGIEGGAIYIDGYDDYLECSSYDGVLSSASRTCMAWVKTTATQQGVIMSWGAGVSGQKWVFRMEAGGFFGVGVYNGYIRTLNTINDGQWHNLAAVLYDDGNPDVSEIKLYIDGIQQDTFASNTQSVNTVASQKMIIGAYGDTDGTKLHFNGMIDNVKLYDRALSSREILSQQ